MQPNQITPINTPPTTPTSDATVGVVGPTTAPLNDETQNKIILEATPGDATPPTVGNCNNVERAPVNIEKGTHTHPTSDASAEDDGSIKIYTVTLSEVRERLAKANIFRGERTLQRYCDKKVLRCNKASNARGQEWLVTDESIDEYINKTPIDIISHPSKDLPEQPTEATPDAAVEIPTEFASKNKAEATADATPPTGTDKEILLERMIDMQQLEIEHLRGASIALTERIHESNTIAQNLQTTILKLTGHEDAKQIHEYNEKTEGGEG